jgi:hypothetical protein
MDVVPFVPSAVVVNKNNNFIDWDKKITESGKFKIGANTSAFSKKGRNDYIRLLINGFYTLSEFKNVSFEELFNPLNGFANFQSLLNAVPVPIDHNGFYLTDSKKKYMVSPFLSTP